jgi:type I restriction enzyme S subunit
MGLSKYKLGDLIKQRREKYDGKEDLQSWGVSRDGFIRPKQEDADTSIYNVFYRNDFVFNPARMELNSIVLNTSYDKAICSSLYEVFYVIREDVVLPEYLNMFIKRDEFARRCWYEAIGSARNYFRVGDLSQFDITLPSIEQQRKYVDVYLSLQNNLATYQSKVDDLKLVCDGHFDEAKKSKVIPLGEIIERVDKKNSEGFYKESSVRGITNRKQFDNTKADLIGSDLSKFLVIDKFVFAYNSRTDGRDMLVLALNKENHSVIVTWNYNAFRIKSDYEAIVNPEYLYSFFLRSEFDRRVRFNSWGSSQELLSWDNLCNIKVPFPDIKIQDAFAEINSIYLERKAIAAQLKEQLNNLCPILIKGSLETRK